MMGPCHPYRLFIDEKGYFGRSRARINHKYLHNLKVLSGHAGQCQTIIFRITGIGTRRNHYRRSSTSQHTCHIGVTKQRHRFIECISRLNIGKDKQIRMSHHRRTDSFHLTAMRITCRLHIHGTIQVHVSVSTGGRTLL